MTAASPFPLLNLDAVEFEPYERRAPGADPARYGSRRGAISARIGATQLGYNVTVIDPGKCAFPFHHHGVNEEMFLMLEGEGEVRLGTGTHPLRAGDIVACPAGGPDTAQQIRNTGTQPLKFLAVSTMRSPEIVQYPDSGKFALRAELPGADATMQRVSFNGRLGDSLDYWEGE